MTPADPKQQMFIDLQRSGECRHPPASDFVRLEFLSCKRCGILFTDGFVDIQAVVLEHQDPPGTEYVSSYLGQHKNPDFEFTKDEASSSESR